MTGPRRRSSCPPGLARRRLRLPPLSRNSTPHDIGGHARKTPWEHGHTGRSGPGRASQEVSDVTITMTTSIVELLRTSESERDLDWLITMLGYAVKLELSTI